MTSGGDLVRGADRLADDLQRTPRQVARHLQAALEVGLLEQTSPGYRGHAATYRATFPEPGDTPQRRSRKGGKTDMARQSSETERPTSPSSLSPAEKSDVLMSV